MPPINRIDLWLDEKIKEMLRVISETDSRSMTKEIEYLIRERFEKPNDGSSFFDEWEQKMAVIDLNEQANKIIAMAQKSGTEQNFLFITTFRRYQVQLKILGDLERALSDSGILVTKEYVKGRANVYSHPAINAYNRTADSANRTASTLMKVITSLKDVSMDVEPDSEL